MVRRDYFSHLQPRGGSIQTRIGAAGYLRGAGNFVFGEVIGGARPAAARQELVQAGCTAVPTAQRSSTAPSRISALASPAGIRAAAAAVPFTVDLAAKAE